MGLYLKTILGSDFAPQDPDIPTAHPLSEFLARVEHQQMRKDLPGVADAGWNEPLEAAPVDKAEAPFANPLNFSKWSMGYKLKIDRIEKKILNGDETWQYCYSAGELVDAREIKR